MRIAGGATLSAPVEVVWAALNDPDILVRAIPGCERLEASGVNAYKVTMSVAITAIKSTFTGEMRVADLRESSFLLIRASAAGGQGTVEVEIAMRLAPSGADATLLLYEADAVVAGLMAAVGQRILATVGKRVADEFLSGLEEQLLPAGARSRAVAAGPPRGEVSEPAEAGRPRGEVSEPAEAGRLRGEVSEPAEAGRLRGEVSEPAEAGRPRAGAGLPAGSAGKAGLLAGGAVGLAGVVVGAVLGRRRRAAGRSDR